MSRALLKKGGDGGGFRARLRNTETALWVLRECPRRACG